MMAKLQLNQNPSKGEQIQGNLWKEGCELPLDHLSLQAEPSQMVNPPALHVVTEYLFEMPSEGDAKPQESAISVPASHPSDPERPTKKRKNPSENIAEGSVTKGTHRGGRKGRSRGLPQERGGKSG